MSDSGYSSSGCKKLSICPIGAEGYFCPPSDPQHGSCLLYPAIIFSCAQAIVIYPQVLVPPKDCSGTQSTAFL